MVLSPAATGKAWRERRVTKRATVPPERGPASSAGTTCEPPHCAHRGHSHIPHSLPAPVVPVGIRVVAALAGRVFGWTRRDVDVAYFYRNDTEPSLPHAEKQSQMPVYTHAHRNMNDCSVQAAASKGPRSIRKIIVMITAAATGGTATSSCPASAARPGVAGKLVHPLGRARRYSGKQMPSLQQPVQGAGTGLPGSADALAATEKLRAASGSSMKAITIPS